MLLLSCLILIGCKLLQKTEKTVLGKCLKDKVKLRVYRIDSELCLDQFPGWPCQPVDLNKDSTVKLDGARPISL